MEKFHFEEEESEIGMARPMIEHNFVEFLICKFIGKIWGAKKIFRSKYMPANEEPVTKIRDTLTPDFTVKERNTLKTKLLIEITRNTDNDQEKIKIYKLMGIEAEMFVYNYIQNKWYKANEEGVLEEGSYCNLFNCLLKEATEPYII